MEFLENNYVVYSIVLVLIIYSACLKPNLPNFIKKLFNNPIVRLIILAIILVSNFKPEISITLAMAFFITINCITEQETMESFANSKVCISINNNQNCQVISENNIQFGVNITNESNTSNSSSSINSSTSINSNSNPNNISASSNLVNSNSIISNVLNSIGEQLLSTKPQSVSSSSNTVPGPGQQQGQQQGQMQGQPQGQMQGQGQPQGQMQGQPQGQMQGQPQVGSPSSNTITTTSPGQVSSPTSSTTTQPQTLKTSM
jgi:hypothetical protein